MHKTTPKQAVGRKAGLSATGRKICSIVEKSGGDIGVREIARQAGCNPSTVSRFLKDHPEIQAKPALSRSGRPPIVVQAGSKNFTASQIQALALFFLGLTREKIEHLVGIKSETLRKCLMGLTRTEKNQRLWDEQAVKRLDDRLDRSFGMGEYVTEMLVMGETFLPCEERGVLEMLSRRGKSPLSFAVPALERILRRKAVVQDGWLVVKGRQKETVKISTKAFLIDGA